MADQPTPEQAPLSKEEAEAMLRDELDINPQLRESLTLAVTPTEGQTAQMSQPDPRTRQSSLWQRLKERVTNPPGGLTLSDVVRGTTQGPQLEHLPSNLELTIDAANALGRGAAKGAVSAVRTVADGVVAASAKTGLYKVGRDDQEEQDFLKWYEQGAATRAPPEIGGVPLAIEDSQLDAWMGPRRGGVMSVVEGIGQFTVGMIGAGRMLKGVGALAPGLAKAAGAMKGAGYLEGAVKGLITDTTFFDPYQERLSNLVESGPDWLKNPVTKYLQADKNDSEAEARLKAGLEGILMGAAVDTVVAGFKAVRARTWAKEGKATAEEVSDAIHEAVETAQAAEVPKHDDVIQILKTPDGRFEVKLRDDVIGTPDSANPDYNIFNFGHNEGVGLHGQEELPPSQSFLDKEGAIRDALHEGGPDWKTAPLTEGLPKYKGQTPMARSWESTTDFRARVSLEANVQELRAALGKEPGNRKLQQRLQAAEGRLEELNKVKPEDAMGEAPLNQAGAAAPPVTTPTPSRKTPRATAPDEVTAAGRGNTPPRQTVETAPQETAGAPPDVEEPGHAPAEATPGEVEPEAAQPAPDAPSFATRAEAESVAASMTSAHENLMRPRGTMNEAQTKAWQENYKLFQSGLDARGAAEVMEGMGVNHNYAQQPHEVMSVLQAMVFTAPDASLAARGAPKTRAQQLAEAGNIFRSINGENVLSLAESVYSKTKDVDNFLIALRAYTTQQTIAIRKLSIAADAAPHNAVAQEQLRQALDSLHDLHAFVSGADSNLARGLDSVKIPHGDAVNQMTKGMEPNVSGAPAAPKMDGVQTRSGDVVTDAVAAEHVPERHQQWAAEKFKEVASGGEQKNAKVTEVKNLTPEQLNALVTKGQERIKAQAEKEAAKANMTTEEWIQKQYEEKGFHAVKEGPEKNPRLYKSLQELAAEDAAHAAKYPKVEGPEYTKGWKTILKQEQLLEKQALKAAKNAKTAAERAAKLAEAQLAKERALIAAWEAKNAKPWWERQYERIGAGEQNPKAVAGPEVGPREGPQVGKVQGPVFDPSREAEDAAKQRGVDADHKVAKGEDKQRAKGEKMAADTEAQAAEDAKPWYQAQYEKMGAGPENPRVKEGPQLPPTQGPKLPKVQGPVYDPGHPALASAEERMRKNELNYDHGLANKENRTRDRASMNTVAQKKRDALKLTDEEQALWDSKPQRDPLKRSVTAGMSFEDRRKLARSVSLADKYDPEAILMALRGAQFQKKAAEVIEPSLRVKMRNAAVSFMVESLLMGPQIQVANLANNMMVAMQRPAEYWWAGVRSKNPELKQFGKDMMHSMFLPDLQQQGWDMFGAMAQNYGEAWKAFKKSLSLGENFIDPSHMTVDGTGGLGSIATDKTGVAGMVHWLGTIGHMSSRMLMSGDEFFKALNYRANVRAQILRQARERGITDPRALAERLHADMDFAFSKGAAVNPTGLQYARIGTLTNDLEYGWGKWLQERVNEVPEARIIFPFLRTPVNSLRYQWERAPILSKRNREFLMDIEAGKDGTQAGLERAAIAKAKVEMGYAVWTSASLMALGGILTGRGASDPQLAAQQRNIPGWQPYSIRIGDRYVSYKKLDAIALPLGMMVDIVTVGREVSSGVKENAIAAVMASITSNLSDRNFMANIAGFMDAMHGNDEKGLESYVTKLALQFVPNLEGKFGVDDTAREASNIVDQLMKRVPGFSDDLPARRNILGEKVMLAPGWVNLKVNPMTFGEAFDDEDIQNKLVAMGKPMTMPPEKVVEGRVDMRDRTQWGVDLYDELMDHVATGGNGRRPLREALVELMNNPQFKTLPKDDYTGQGGLVFTKVSELIQRYHQAAFQQVLTDPKNAKFKEAYIQAKLAVAYGEGMGKDAAQQKMKEQFGDKLMVKPR